jgi:hypothetical protein
MRRYRLGFIAGGIFFVAAPACLAEDAVDVSVHQVSGQIYAVTLRMRRDGDRSQSYARLTQAAVKTCQPLGFYIVSQGTATPEAGQPDETTDVLVVQCASPPAPPAPQRRP